MKVGTVVAVVVLAAAAAGGTYWISRSDTPAPPSDTSRQKTALDEVEEEPEPSRTGPHPKAVVPEMNYGFGIMKVGDTQKHVFVVRNEGQAPLKLGKPHTTCQCTISEAAKNEIPPGGEGTITLEWKPAVAVPEFNKGAVIKTNDPEMPEIRLSVYGIADVLLHADPADIWRIDEIAGDISKEVRGGIFSRLLDDFKIESITSSNPLLTAQVEPMPEKSLKQLRAKSGYGVRARVAPGMPVGKFVEMLTIRTDVEEKDFQELKVQVTGTRRGPIQILPTPGTKWNPDSMAIDLGRFPSSAGASGTVQVFVAGLSEDQELKFESVKSDVPYVTAELKKDENFKASNRQKYVLTFTVPPNSPPASHRAKSAALVTATTTHPEAKEMKFLVSFVSVP